ncbi:MAG: multiheme c-type cytochrome [Desulfuromonadales bacterium]|nr:multiheme c-type cytochrome [Desulfuromonadales bacterium]
MKAPNCRNGLTIAVFLWLVAVVPAGAAQEQTVCLQCHGGLDGHLGAPVGLWQTSVHAENGISCHDCHGGDPTDFVMAMSPERGFIGVPAYAEVPEFCGRCHVGVLGDYRESAHGQAIDRGGAQCVTCHGNHAVVRAHPDLINEQDCSRCHDYGRAAEIKQALKETDAGLLEMDRELQRIHKRGFSTEVLEGALFDLRNRFHRVFHSVDVQKVRQETGGVQAELDKLADSVKEFDTTQGKRKLWGSVAVALLVLLGVIFLLVRKTYEEEEQGG